MTIPSWLAPNAELAEPRVKKFGERIAEYVNADIVDFWAAEPTTHDVSDIEGNQWIEAWFCLQLKGVIPRLPMCTINRWRKTIHCFHAEWSDTHQCTEVLLSGPRQMKCPTYGKK